MAGFEELLAEDKGNKQDCNLCKESQLKVGKKTGYGAAVIFRIGNGLEDGWFATLSPKTGGNPEEDFSIQLMPFAHLTHFSQMAKYPELAKNYGTAFARVSRAMAEIMASENKEFNATAGSRELAVSVATYGKCTNWGEKKEHLHLKIFPFKGNVGQPYTVDSSFGRKEICKDSETGEEFVKMKPVKKVLLEEKRFEGLSKRLVEILSEAEK